jgi:hypothetical protein
VASPLHPRARARRFLPADHGPGLTLDEQHLLGLIASARNDVSANNGAALYATLSQFVTEVRTLRSSGELSAAIAAGLERQAVATEARAAQQLRPAVQASDTVDVARRSRTPTAASRRRIRTPRRPL